MSEYRISGSILGSTGKKGIIVPDKDGYYDLTMGGLNTFNRSNEYYSAQEAIALFENSSILMRRVKESALFSELGHPKQIPGMSNEAYYSRVLSIEETNICAHIKDLTLDLTYGQRNPNLTNRECIRVLGKVAPAGPHANTLKLAVENIHQNCPFSVRGLTRNETNYKGYTERHLTTIVTYDFVTEPGIPIANRHTALGLESMSLEDQMNDLVDKELMLLVLEKNLTNGIALESTQREFFEDVKESLSKTKVKRKKNLKIFQW